MHTQRQFHKTRINLSVIQAGCSRATVFSGRHSSGNSDSEYNDTCCNGTAERQIARKTVDFFKPSRAIRVICSWLCAKSVGVVLMMLLPLWLACALGGKEAIQQAIVPLPVGDHGMVLTAWGQSGSSSKALTERNQDGATTANARSQSQGDETFGFEKLHRLHLTLATNQWVALQNTKGGGPFGRPGGEETAAVGGEAGPSDFHRTGMTEFPWAHVQLAEEGRVYTNVAVRYKRQLHLHGLEGPIEKIIESRV